MNWNLAIQQLKTIVKVELTRYLLARRWLGVYLAAFAPSGVLTLAVIFNDSRRVPSLSDFSEIYAVLFQTFVLRLSVFLSSALVFSQLFRGEMLEKTLHFYLLTPVRREVIAAGKYIAGVTAMTVVFGISTILSNLLIYMNSPSMGAFFFEGPGMSYLAAYVLGIVLACAAYGGIFMLATWFDPKPREITVSIPPDRFVKQQ